MESKELDVLQLFFDNPTRELHFEEILREARITRSKAAAWLNNFVKEDLITRVKERNKMPYYLSNYESSAYRNKKKLFAFTQLYESGLLNSLSSLEKAKAVILFGSFARSDWYKNSDIDIFIYGNPEGLNIANYELKLNREIQLFICHNKEELNKFSSGLIRNIIKGNLIKGDIDFIKVEANA